VPPAQQRLGGPHLAGQEVDLRLVEGPELAALDCAECRTAAGSDGFCARHGRGFVGGRAYLSRLAYHLARGEPEAVQAELRVVERAIAESARCELCAAAMVLDGTCPVCRISYREGTAVER